MQAYTLTDLGVPPGNPDNNSFAYGINDAGQVVGVSLVESSSGAVSGYATLWSDGVATDLGGPPGSTGGVALAINDLGQVVGYTSALFGEVATLWSGGVATNLGVLPGFPNSFAYGINDAGQVVGGSLGGHGGFEAATLWSGGSIIDLGGLPGSTGSYAFAINNAGQVVGASQFGNGSNYESDATLWSGGSVTDLGVLPGDTGSVAIAINNRGEAVGYSVTNGGGIDNATLWSGGTITSLGALPGSITSTASAINDAGQIVGQSYNANTGWHATLWSDGSIIDLNSLVGSSYAGWDLEDATAINNQGQIAGYGLNPSGHFDAFLLTPVLPPTISFISPVIDAAADTAWPVTVSGLGDETGTLVFSDTGGDKVSVNITGNGEYLVNLSTLNDGSIASTLSVSDETNSQSVSGGPLTLVGAALPGSSHIQLPATSTGNLGTVGGNGPSVIDGSQTTKVTFTTGNGPDTIVAGVNDVIHAGTGTDTLVGANGATLYAGSGPDILYGAPGATLVGGSGPDTFAFEPGFGKNTISNFHASNEVLQFNPSVFASYSAMVSAGDITPSGANTIITDHAGDTVTLTGVAASSLTAHNFHFA